MSGGRQRHDGQTPDIDLPGAFGRFLTIGIVALVVTIGGCASVLLDHQIDNNAAAAQRDVAQRAAKELQATSNVIEAGFSGVNALVRADGSVNEISFRSFAREVADATGTGPVAFESLVADSQRAAWQRSNGTTITEVGPSGELENSTHRGVYAPIQWIEPPSAPAAEIVGFDFMSEPIRAAALAAARDTTMTVFSAPGIQQPNGSSAFFVVHALFRPGAPLATESQRRDAFVGALSSAVGGTQLLDAIGKEVPHGTRLRITDGETVLASTAAAPRGGDQAPVAGGGRPWVVTVDTPDPSHLSALLLALATIGAAALVAMFLARNRHKTLQLRSSAQAIQELGLLSERLAASENVDHLADVVATHAASMVGAQRVVLAVPAAEGDGLTRPGSGGGPIGEQPQPLLRAWRADRVVTVADPAQIRRDFPEAERAFSARGVEAVAVYPLRQPDGVRVGVLGFEWSRRPRFDGPMKATLQAAVELCQQHVARMYARSSRRSTALALSMLGQRLSVARTFDEVAVEVVHHGPAASGAPIVVIGFFNADERTLRLLQSGTDSAGRPNAEMFVELSVSSLRSMLPALRRGQSVRFDNDAEIDRHPELRKVVGQSIHSLRVFPLLDSSAELVALLAFVRDDSRLPEAEAAEPGRAESIADLTAQTVERATLYQRQHELVTEMQRRTLGTLADVEGLRIAARYLPSSEMLGLGGDWYDVQPLGEGCTGLIVGDVVGHGIEAIADMTEIRTTVSTLLRRDPDLSEVAFSSSAMLDGDRGGAVVFATVALLLIETGEGAAADGDSGNDDSGDGGARDGDAVALPVRAPRGAERRGTLTYVRAGHPPPLLCSADGQVRVLDAAGTTPIGVIGPRAEQQRVAVFAGDVLVVYTDGLIERRGETIDDGIARLMASLAGCACGGASDPGQIADTLVDDLLGDRNTEDDTALVVVVVE